MFKCVECGHLFELGEEKRFVEAHGEEYLGCAICGGAYEETVRCKKCGTHRFEDELYNGICAECIGEAMTLANMVQYLDDSSLEADFYIGEFYKSNFDYASPELIDLARCGFKRAVMDDSLKKIDHNGYLPEKYESPKVAQLRRFVVDGDYGMYDFAAWLNKKEEKKNG